MQRPGAKQWPPSWGGGSLTSVVGSEINGSSPLQVDPGLYAAFHSRLCKKISKNNICWIKKFPGPSANLQNQDSSSGSFTFYDPFTIKRGWRGGRHQARPTHSLSNFVTTAAAATGAFFFAHTDTQEQLQARARYVKALYLPCYTTYVEKHTWPLWQTVRYPYFRRRRSFSLMALRPLSDDFLLLTWCSGLLPP